TQAFLELPATEQNRPVAAQLVEDAQLVRGEGGGGLEKCPPAVLDPPGPVPHRWQAAARRSAPALRAGRRGGAPCLVAFAVPGPPAGPVDGLVRERHQVEGVHTLAGLWRPGIGCPLERPTPIHADCLQLSATRFAQLVVEGLQGGRVLALAGPDHPAGPVVVGDHGQEPVSLAVADLVDPDPQPTIQPTTVDLFGNNPGNDPGDGLPRGPQQPGDRGLVGVLGQPRDHVLEVTRVPCPRPRPGHHLGPDPTTAPAVQPSDPGLEEQLAGAQVQMPPPANRGGVGGGGPPATRAPRTAPAAPQPDQNTLGGELDRGHRGRGNRQDLVEC